MPSPQSFRRADVYVQGAKAARLAEVERGYEFSYLPSYLASAHPLPVSVTLPLSDTPYQSRILFPFFDGLIPEGWLLNFVKSHWGIPERDRFGVLLVACRDCIGDVQIAPEGASL